MNDIFLQNLRCFFEESRKLMKLSSKTGRSVAARTSVSTRATVLSMMLR
jgi:hypothetical protein